MAIYYVDIYNGNDSNNGQSGSTAKKTFNATTPLITSQSDSIRCRGWDYNTASIGDIWWRNGSTSLTGTTDLTGSLSVGTYIYKSTDTEIKEPYRISSLSFSAGVMTITLVLLAGYYEGTTEYCGVVKMTLPATGITAQQTMSKDGYYIGTQTYALARTGVSFSGGWDETYTNRTGYTIFYKNTSSVVEGSKSYWDWSYFMLIETTNYNFNSSPYSNTHHFSIVNCSIGGPYFTNYSSGTYMLISNQTAGGAILESTADTIYQNCKFRGGGLFNYGANTCFSKWINCEFSNQNSMVNFNENNACFIGCSIKLHNLDWLSANNVYYSGNTIKHNSTSYRAFNGAQGIYAINNILIGGNTKIKNSSGTFINNGISGYEGDTALTQIQVSQTKIIEPTLETFILPTQPIHNPSYPSYPAAFTGITNYYDTYWDQITQNIILKNNKNIILYNSASVETTGITYSGDTYSITGQTGLKLTQYTSTSEGKVGAVDFIVNSGSTYNLSFYVKSSNNQSFSFNYMSYGQYMNTTWITGATSSSTWTQYTAVLPAITTTGFVKLYFKFNSGTGHYLYVSNISLT